MRQKHFGFYVLALVAVLTVVNSSPASAAAATTMADVLGNIKLNIHSFTVVAEALAYLMGLSLGVIGIFKFKDHVDNPQMTPLSAGIKRFVAGGMLFSLPFMTKVITHSLYKDDATAAASKIGHGAGFTSASLSGGLDTYVVNFISNIAGPAEDLLVAVGYVAGIAFLILGISRLTKRMEEGPRGPGGIGTIATFIAAGMLFATAGSMGSLVATVFGDNKALMHATIDAGVIADATDRDRIQKVVEGVMVFVALVGYIAFIRGWFVLRSFADGQSGSSLAQGLTFLIGGALAINLGQLVNILQATIGLGTNPLTFS